MEFKENSLGDISGMMQDQIPDLEWLAVSPGDNAVPVVNNPHFAVPQLEEAWGWESYRNPVTNLVPNTIMGGPGVVAVSPEEIDATVKVTKKAMMQGLKGPELLAHLRERVASKDPRGHESETGKRVCGQGKSPWKEIRRDHPLVNARP